MADTLCHLFFNISETDHATKKITADIAISLKVLMDKQKKYCHIPLNYLRNQMQARYLIRCQKCVIILTKQHQSAEVLHLWPKIRHELGSFELPTPGIGVIPKANCFLDSFEFWNTWRTMLVHCIK